MPTLRRAVRYEQKQQRRQAILDVAWEMAQHQPHAAITMNDVADRAGLAKGTIYLYFRTKEELLLAVLEQQLRAWFDEVDVQLQQAQDSHAGSITHVAQIICASLEARPAMARLLAILHSVLEQNIELEAAVRFKQMLLKHLTRTGALLEACLSFLQPGQGAHVFLQAQALIIGLQHLADPSPIVRQALAEPGMDIFEVDFAREFATTFAALLYGIEAKGSNE
jgi:AcrR family transcriptional regulator